jgi:hypothetical protein
MKKMFLFKNEIYNLYTDNAPGSKAVNQVKKNEMEYLNSLSTKLYLI